MKHVMRILEERTEYQNKIANSRKNKKQQTKSVAKPPIQPKI